MNYILQQSWWKYFLLIAALLIGIFSLLYTNKLVSELAWEEKRKVELWASAYKHFNIVDDDNVAFDFLFRVIQENETVPVILGDDEGNILTSRNLNAEYAEDESYLKEQLEIMKSQHEPIAIEFNDSRHFIYYKESNLVRQLRIFPYVQLFIISIFIIIAYYAFNAARRYEQNQVWVGMSKETAHQLGTPLSSLMAWIDYLDEPGKTIDQTVVKELRKDVERLQLVTDRFSKVGSSPVLTRMDMYDLIADSVEYLRTRVSKKINIIIEKNTEMPIEAFVSPPLFSWVIENLTKNAIDAMSGEGKLLFRLSRNRTQIIIDVIDTGKGIPGKNLKKIFRPGFSTRKRGWGLGLSLAYRIIVFYHKGSLFVKESEPGKGTTMRIKLPV